MILRLTTLSPLLSSSGESSAHIDADVKFDTYGLPCIQGRTIKGLLRESALEICEMEGTGYEKVHRLFGVQGSGKSTSLFFSTLRIENYTDIIDDLRNMTGLESTDIASYVKEHFTLVRKQTALQDGVAFENTLRNYRLIRKGVVFNGTIEGSVTSEEETLLSKAILNLRHMGVRRNRGFGMVRLITEGHLERGPDTLPISNPASIEVNVSGEPEEQPWKMGFRVTTENAVLFSKVIGEQNTVSTETFIPSRSIWGLVAGLLLEKLTESSKSIAHKEGTPFHNIILGNKVRFGPAYYDRLSPIPRVYGYNKSEDSPLNKNMLLAGGEALKGRSGFGCIKNGTLYRGQPETSFSFHNSRNNDRIAGKSMEGSGAIFYYEALEQGQDFMGEMTGTSGSLWLIKELLEQKKGMHRLGRSKTAQYSQLKIEVDDPEPIDLEKRAGEISHIVEKGSLYLVLKTPLSLLNDAGLSVANISLLQKELNRCLGPELHIENASTATEWAEHYLNTWASKTPRDTVFAPGSVFELKCSSWTQEIFTALARLEIQGIGEHKNEGYGIVEVQLLPETLNDMEWLAEKRPENKNTGKEPKTELGRKIRDYIEREKHLNAIRLEAFKLQQQKIPNSLIVRMREKLREGERTWSMFLTDIAGKKAEKTLKDARLLEDLTTLRSPDLCQSFEDKREYWMTYFKLIHRKNKKQKT